MSFLFMGSSRKRRVLWGLVFWATTCGVWAASAFPATAGSPAAENSNSPTYWLSPQESGVTEVAPRSPLSGKQKRELMKYNFEKMKSDADELVNLAKSLQEELNKSNENILSLEVIDKTEQIEKLAKRIRNGAKGM